ncbi:MAG: hypothetical protein WCF16_02935, partial [Alphaproteobacteria bacterium]
MERVVVLVKALPHAGKRHGETVCCAGITEHGEWRRQFPIHFRRLREKFNRWDRIEYEYRTPKDDKRPESRRVQEDTIRVVGSVPLRERANLLSRVIVSSTARAAAGGQTLALIRPRNVRFVSKKKTSKDIDEEQRAYRAAASQGTFFDKDLAELEPCPYAFKFEYEDQDGHAHTSTCDDWETAAMFRQFTRRYDEKRALSLMKKTFEQ